MNEVEIGALATSMCREAEIPLMDDYPLAELLLDFGQAVKKAVLEERMEQDKLRPEIIKGLTEALEKIEKIVDLAQADTRRMDALEAARGSWPGWSMEQDDGITLDSASETCANYYPTVRAACDDLIERQKEEAEEQ